MAGHIKHQWPAGTIKVEVAGIHEFALGLKVEDQRGIIDFVQRKLNWLAIHGGPRLAEVFRLDIIKVRTLIHVAIRMIIEKTGDLGATDPADLIMTAEAGKFAVGSPCLAIGAGLPIEFTIEEWLSCPGILGE